MSEHGDDPTVVPEVSGRVESTLPQPLLHEGLDLALPDACASFLVVGEPDARNEVVGEVEAEAGDLELRRGELGLFAIDWRRRDAPCGEALRDTLARGAPYPGPWTLELRLRDAVPASAEAQLEPPETVTRTLSQLRWLGRAVSERVVSDCEGALERTQLDVAVSIDGDTGTLQGVGPLEDIDQPGWNCVRDSFSGYRLRPEKPGTLIGVVVLELPGA